MTSIGNCPTRILINNQWKDAISGKTFITRNPATEEILCRVAEGDAEDIDLAVKAAREAFDNGPWRSMPPSQRAAILFKYFKNKIVFTLTFNTFISTKIVFFKSCSYCLFFLCSVPFVEIVFTTLTLVDENTSSPSLMIDD